MSSFETDNSYKDYGLVSKIEHGYSNKMLVNKEELLDVLDLENAGGVIQGPKGDAGKDGTTPHIDEETKRWFIGDYDTGYVAVPNIIDIPAIPVALSQLINDENFIKNTVDNLLNYYRKDEVYSKLEITTLMGNLNTISVAIVEQLPESDISATTIYLIAIADNVYSQHMYIKGEWADFGNTDINLENYVTVQAMQDALKLKAEVNHTHEGLHTHDNKAVLDQITQESIQKWNNTFSGKYNDLTGLPNIPVVTNDLTDDLKAGYDEAVAKTHSHSNATVLNKFSEATDGNVLYNGKVISSGGSGEGGTGDYNDSINKPKINSVELVDDKTAQELGFSTVATSGEYGDLNGLPVLATKLSDLQDDVGFITVTVDNLVNYYTKNQTYSKAETNELINNISTLGVLIVETLPTNNISTNTIYLIKIAETNVYEQWMYINSIWANMGSTEISLSNYYTKSQVDSLLANKISVTAGMGLSQENFTTYLKNKLEGLNNYVLPASRPDRLGGVMVDGITTATDSFGNLVVRFPEQKTEINDSATVTNKTWSSNKISTEISKIDRSGATINDTAVNDYQTWSSKKLDEEFDGVAVIDDAIKGAANTWSSNKISSEIGLAGNIANDINIAQKTVNTKGTKELLASEQSFTLPLPTTNGTPTISYMNRSIDLKESIENYSFLHIQLALKSTGNYYKTLVNTVDISSVVYNNSDTRVGGDGSAFFLDNGVQTDIAGSFGQYNQMFTAWFKTPTKIFIELAVNPVKLTGFNEIAIVSIKGVNVENVTIDPVEYINTAQGIEDTPVGHILSFMGKTAPKHYLSCDGAEYNIVDYPYLAQYIKDQFGTFNFFGGDGTTTFRVPDLRNEFLRGYHGTKSEQLSRDIGMHQNATIIPGWYNNGYGTGIAVGLSSSDIDKTNNTVNRAEETDHDEMGNYGYLQFTGKIETAATPIRSFTARPGNTTVLYCIKYEPTYFMNIVGLVEESTLWEGNIGNTTTTQTRTFIDLTDSIMNYDKIGFFFRAAITTGSNRPQYKEIPPSVIKEIIDKKDSTYTISLCWGYSNTTDYSDISINSTVTKLEFAQVQSYVTKIVGIKYKSFQGQGGIGGCDCPTYTNDEIREYVEGILNGN